jgi:hypothetical protein
MEPVVGGRVLVPFRQQRMSGIVVELHDRPPQENASHIKTKKVLEALDLSPVLDEHLLKLGKWIADYYLAPVGEVFRTMLPLSAEFKRAVTYRITDEGRMALHLAGMSGSPARSKRTPEQQLVEFRVLDYLAERESVREASLRAAARVSKALLAGWCERSGWCAKMCRRRGMREAGEGGGAAERGIGLRRRPRGGFRLRRTGQTTRPHLNLAPAGVVPKKLNDNQRALIDDPRCCRRTRSGRGSSQSRGASLHAGHTGASRARSVGG